MVRLDVFEYSYLHILREPCIIVGAIISSSIQAFAAKDRSLLLHKQLCITLVLSFIRPASYLHFQLAIWTCDSIHVFKLFHFLKLFIFLLTRRGFAPYSFTLSNFHLLIISSTISSIRTPETTAGSLPTGGILH